MMIKVFNTKENRYLDAAEIEELLRDTSIEGFCCSQDYSDISVMRDVYGPKYPKYVVQIKEDSKCIPQI